jgi:hypothetical protein
MELLAFLPMMIGRSLYRVFPRSVREYIELDSDLGALVIFFLGLSSLLFALVLTYFLFLGNLSS